VLSIFEMRSCELLILLISSSQVARITSVSHWYPAMVFNFLSSLYILNINPLLDE
jgi:hypothetical protein